MDWYAEVELAGALDDEQMERAAEGATIGHYDSGTHVLTLRQAVDAEDYTAAAAWATGWVAGLPAVTELVAAGVLTGPRRLLVESSDSRAARTQMLLGPAEVAARLGVTPARVRQLEQRPDFPVPAASLGAGRIYNAADIDEFDRGWDRSPGRPRKVPAE